MRDSPADGSRERLPAAAGGPGGRDLGGRRGFPVDPPRVQDHGSRVEQRRGLFTQLWGSAGPGEGEDVFRASLIMAAWEEINRAGPAGMLQLLPPAGGGGAWSGRGRGGPGNTGGILHNTCRLVHICAATLACKSAFQVWPDADGAPKASARTRGHFPSERARLTAPPNLEWDSHGPGQDGSC